jgi:DNA-binding NtrC family response regulator
MQGSEAELSLACDEARLLIHHLEGKPTVHRLSRELPTLIGRGLDCDVRLPDDSCSRQHCRIECTGEDWIIYDLDSRNGTILNGERVSRRVLDEGDVLTVGHTWLVFTCTGASAPPESNGSDTAEADDTRISFDDPPQRNPSPERPAEGNRGRRSRSSHEHSRSDNDMSTIATPARIGDALIGVSEALQEVISQVAQAAPTDATVLLRGESGVGKELVAREIHIRSRRNRAPFVCVNCAALSESLLESELFGHERGAFTGATEQKKGKFEQAHMGTIFLDEIGEMSPTIQAKFLRVLEGHPFERVGGQSAIQVNVRVVAATNLDLEQAVREGRFRRDLYFRLNVLPISIPPLRTRSSDIPVLATYFVERLAKGIGRNVPNFTPEAMERLRGYDWPGNVRELRNTIERAVVLGRGDSIDADDLSFSGLETAPLESDQLDGLSLDAVELQHILRTLRMTRWNKAKTSRILGIERSTLDRKLKRNNIERPEEFGGATDN